MLEIKKIKKVYQTKELHQVALDGVSINFRKCEFASILGPSGSGKTTLLNIIGGLDHYDSGDLIINEISTKKYKSRDWDTYRNHRVGFVFQSYNLIAHQNILKNVELALTLSGVSKKERTKKAKEVLKKVGLQDHMKKRPNQLSGGQMQRVAIARALVNNPDILLADEPTGALDSETSKQIMKLIQEISLNRLVIMVTHNPDIAKEYSTRIIKLKDGKIINDSKPYDGKDNTEKIGKKKTRKTSMNLKTALSLSLNNLMTKKGRTFLTAFAGSIGIIGIALILSLSNGVNEYIDRTQKETLATYPLMIESTSVDISSLMKKTVDTKDVKCQKSSICTTDDITINPSIQMTSATTKNNLKDFKIALDNNFKNINDYVTDIQYTYNLDLQIYSTRNDKITRVNPNSFSLNTGDVSNEATSHMAMMQTNTDVFKELINNEDLLNGQYDVVAGTMPKEYNEIVLVTDKKGQIPASLLYSLDLKNRDDLNSIINDIKNGKNETLDTINYNYNDLVGSTYKLVMNTDYYTKEHGYWIDNSANKEYLKKIVDNGEELKIVGILKQADDSVEAESGFVGYLHSLNEHVINKVKESNIAQEQLNNQNINVFTKQNFDENLTYEQVASMLGIAEIEKPSTINIYPKDYEAKEKIEDIITKYNKTQDNKDNKISYTDYVGVLMTSVTSIVDIITYVLIAFVAISLVVSSIMIAIITYISVLERTKEIGILRAIGASKKDITRVFNAETIIEGLIAGILGIIVTILLCIPINSIVESLTNVKGIASLPTYGAVALIIISVLLTLIAGLIPAKMASKKDPVESLRTE